MRMLVIGRRARRRKRLLQIIERCKRHSAKDPKLQRPRCGFDLAERTAEADRRMRKERQKRTWCEFDFGLKDEPRQRARRALPQRVSSRIFDLHLPSGKFGRDSARN